MVGGLVRLCGLPFGDDLPNNHEDPEFNFEQYARRGEDPIAGIRASIRRRNSQHETWGWKYPRAARYLDQVRADLRNPHLIVVMRDPVAAAGRHRDIHGLPADAVRVLHQFQDANLELAERWQVPTLLVSYERGAEQPVRLARQLARFLGLPEPADRQRVRSFVQRGTYQAID